MLNDELTQSLNLLKMNGTKLDGNIVERAFINEHEGYGIVFKNDMKTFDGIFLDEPLFSHLHFYTRKSSLVCDNCYKSVGSLIENVNHVLKIEDRKICDDVELKLREYEPLYPQLSGNNYLECRQNCGATYCSKSCLLASNPVHRVFCDLMSPQERKKWDMFTRHSLLNHESFYFAGTIYVAILSDAIYNGVPMSTRLDKLDEYYSRRWDYLSSSTGDKEQFCKAMESFELLKDALQRFKNTAECQGHSDVNRLFEIKYYLKLLGTIDMVSVDIEIPHPLNQVLAELYEKEKSLFDILSRDLATVKRILYGGDSMESNCLIVFPDIIGLGIFNSLSKMNHSCEPNLEIDYSTDKVAIITLLKDVSSGQQATISYIDEFDTYERRRSKLLNNYGFVCKCAKCLAQASEADSNTD